MTFAYFAALPLVFEFITYFAPEGVAVMTDIGKYLSFVLSMFMAFGVTFEVPVFVIILVRTGTITIEKLREIRPYVIVGAFVIAAIFTPPDVVSQFMLAVPLCLLYELGIFIAALMIKPRHPALTSDPLEPADNSPNDKTRTQKKPIDDDNAS